MVYFIQLLNEKKLKKVDKLFENFEDADTANNLLKLKHFRKFSGTTEALEGIHLRNHRAYKAKSSI